MHVLTSEEARELNEQGTMSVLKQKLRKSVQMSGTAQSMPQTQPRYPPVAPRGEWQMESGARQDAQVEAQQSQFGGTVRGEGLPAPTYSGAVMGARSETGETSANRGGISAGAQQAAGGQAKIESGPTSPANPLVGAPLNEEPGVTWQELARLREERARAKIQHEAYLEQYNEAKKQREKQEERDAKTRKLQAKIEELRLKSEQQEIPPPSEGASPEITAQIEEHNRVMGHPYIPEPDGTSGRQYDAQTEGRINPMFGGTTGRMEEPSEAQMMGTNPPGKLSASPGKSGSSGVYHTNASNVIVLSGNPNLRKGFEAQNRRFFKTVCKDCGADVSEEGSEEHWNRTEKKCSHFRNL